jgi:FKBP-type peptidyl-prolyl cis-trans isomerase
MPRILMPVLFFCKEMRIQLASILTILLLAMASCQDATTTSNLFDPAKQAAADEDKLKAWFLERGISDSVIRTSSGLYYRITKSVPDSILAGPDSLIPNPAKKPVAGANRVYVRYEGRLLSDSLFDSNLKSASAFSFFPGAGNTIKAWEEGLFKFHEGEEGFLYAPSGLGYGNTSQFKIPANSCLRFYIRISTVE